MLRPRRFDSIDRRSQHLNLQPACLWDQVSSASGDVRRCLELCSRAVDLAAAQAAQEAESRGEPAPEPQPDMVRGATPLLQDDWSLEVQR